MNTQVTGFSQLCLELEQLEQVDKFAEEQGLPQVEIKTRGYFCGRMYVREAVIPEGMMVSGKIHLKPTISVLAKGKMLITSPGQEPVEINAPQLVLAQPGTKRVAITLTECVWYAVVETDKTTEEEVEAESVVSTLHQYLEFLSKREAP